MLRTVEVSARLPGTNRELFAILTDYELYRHWIAGLDRSRLLAREGDVAVIELRYPSIDPGGVTLEMVAVEQRRLDFHQIGRFGRPQVAGRLELSAERDRRVEATLRLTVATPLLAFGSRRRIRLFATAVLGGLGARRDRLAAWGPGNRSRRKILEVKPAADGLAVDYLGHTFTMAKRQPEETS